MGFIELFLIGVALSMDAFAVSLCNGLKMQKLNLFYSSIIAFSFGFFQALMPLIGFFLGTRFSNLISSFDHWIAFVLLLFIGGKMLYEALSEKGENETEKNYKLNIKELFLMSFATSVDALAVGITFAFLKVNIVFSAILIGLTTFAISFTGVIIGNFFGAKYKNKAEILGGIILIAIGTKILIEHLFFAG